MPVLPRIARPATVASESAPNRATTSFDAIRLAAAFAVLVSHHYAVAGKAEPQIGGFGSLGFFAVAIFFVISGYFVAASWDRDSHLIRYWTKRVLRIFPGLMAIVAVTILLIGPLATDGSMSAYAKDPLTWTYWRNAVLVSGIQFRLPGVFTSNVVDDVNLSLWTLPVELAMYALLSVVGFAFARSARWLYPVIATALGIAWLMTPEPESFALTQALNLGVYFFAGATIFAFRLMDRITPLVLATSIGLVVVGGAHGGQAAHALLWVAFPVVIMVFGARASQVGERVAAFGDISYGVYLWAFPIQQLIIGWGGMGFWASMALAMMLTTLAGIASMVVVERPALMLRPSRSTSSA
jgi:peptidoglycan/LPS O-acetylase OafA/YrhL